MADFYAARAGTNAGAPLDGFLTAVHTDEMIERGWQAWKPDWGRNSPGLHWQANRNSLVEGLHEIERMYSNDVQPPSIPS